MRVTDMNTVFATKTTLFVSLLGLTVTQAWAQASTYSGLDYTKTTVNQTGVTASAVEVVLDQNVSILGHYDGGHDYLGEGNFASFATQSLPTSTSMEWSNFTNGNGFSDIHNGDLVMFGFETPLVNYGFSAMVYLDSNNNILAGVSQVAVVLAVANSSVQATVHNDSPYGSLSPVTVTNFQFGTSPHKLSLDELFPSNSELIGLLHPLPNGPSLTLSSGDSAQFDFPGVVSGGDFIEMSYDVTSNGETIHDVEQLSRTPGPAPALAFLGGLAAIRRRRR